MSHKLFDMLHLLDAAGVYYTLSRHRPESVMITVTMIGERMEIDVFEDGHIDILVSSGEKMSKAM